MGEVAKGLGKATKKLIEIDNDLRKLVDKMLLAGAFERKANEKEPAKG